MSGDGRPVTPQRGVGAPPSAWLIAQASGIANGQLALVSLYQGRASRSRGSDHRCVPTRWLTIRYYDPDQRRVHRRSHSYSGRNLDAAMRAFNATAADLRLESTVLPDRFFDKPRAPHEHPLCGHPSALLVDDLPGMAAMGERLSIAADALLAAAQGEDPVAVIVAACHICHDAYALLATMGEPDFRPFPAPPPPRRSTDVDWESVRGQARSAKGFETAFTAARRASHRGLAALGLCFAVTSCFQAARDLGVDLGEFYGPANVAGVGAARVVGRLYGQAMNRLSSNPLVLGRVRRGRREELRVAIGPP